MISIVSGPTCVGKTYFIDSKKDRLLEITNFLSFEEDVSIKLENVQSLVRWWSCSKKHSVDWEEYLLEDDELTCVHYDITVRKHGTLNHEYYTKKISELKTSKNIIVLGVPYTEYKVRVGQRYECPSIPQNWTIPVSNRSSQGLSNLYKDWINELNKNEIPYLLVEASGDYKVLEEKEFFRMLK